MLLVFVYVIFTKQMCVYTYCNKLNDTIQLCGEYILNLTSNIIIQTSQKMVCMALQELKFILLLFWVSSFGKTNYKLFNVVTQPTAKH